MSEAQSPEAAAAAPTPPSQPAQQVPPATAEQQSDQAPDTGQPASSADKIPGAPEAATPPAEDGQQGDAAEKKPKSRFQERIDELTARARTAERRAVAAEARAAHLEKQLTPPPADAPLEVHDEYRVKKAVNESRIEELRHEASDAQAEASRATFDKFAAKAEAVAERMPGLVDKFCTLPEVSPVMAGFVADSDKGAEVAFHLASNPAEATRIARLPPAHQGIELARLEARLVAAPQVRKTSTAPPPPPTMPGAPSPAVKGPEDMSVADIQKLLYGKVRG